jgi:phage terminase large subunit-like protein
LVLDLDIVDSLTEAHSHGAYHTAMTTKGQRLFMSATDDVALWRDSNGIGKSVALALLAHDACRGFDRFGTGAITKPVNVLVAGTSWEQMVPLMEKLWQFAPRDELHPKCGFDPGRGITGKPPRIVYTSGPGAGKVIQLATYKQGSARIAGAQVGLLILDEPPPEAFYGEAVPRVLRGGGKLRLGFTPTVESPPLDYLWKLIEEGRVHEYNWGISEEACWLEGAPTPWKSQEELDAWEEQLLPAERAMRTGRSRYPLVGGRAFMSFDQATMVRDEYPLGQLAIAVGIDYGADSGAQVAELSAVRIVDGFPQFWALDEYVADGNTSVDQDAKAIVEMLKRNHLELGDVDQWVGDRRYGGKQWGGAKDNELLTQAFCRLLGRPMGSLGFTIETAYKPKGSVYEGVKIMHAAMMRNQFVIRPRCKKLIDAVQQWAWRDDEHKHKIDAYRYGAVSLVRREGYGPSKIRMW